MSNGQISKDKCRMEKCRKRNLAEGTMSNTKISNGEMSNGKNVKWKNVERMFELSWKIKIIFQLKDAKEHFDHFPLAWIFSTFSRSTIFLFDVFPFDIFSFGVCHLNIFDICPSTFVHSTFYFFGVFPIRHFSLRHFYGQPRRDRQCRQTSWSVIWIETNPRMTKTPCRP